METENGAHRAAGFVAGTLIGLGCAEFSLPVLVALFRLLSGLDIMLAGSLSLAASVLTMLAGFARCRSSTGARAVRSEPACY